MAAKIKSFFSCQSCGSKFPKWMGRCSDCGEWNTLVEERDEGTQRGRWISSQKGAAPVLISDVSMNKEERVTVGIPEFDRVVGGGIVPGSFVLIGGDPGIGKSTILLQISHKLTQNNLPVLYITGEESGSQVRMRSDRIGKSDGSLYIMAETSLEAITPHIERISPSLVIIDSIQTLYTSQLESAPGSISQVREVAAQLLQLAKKTGITIFLAGHVTKDGAIAGPRVLEHMVDTVLYFEGDTSHSHRILRAVKNRFGPVNEIGIFEMKQNGLTGISNPSEIFLAEKPKGVSGSVVTATVEGRRPLLVEIQALVSSTYLAMPRRNVIGMDTGRVSLLLAILEKRAGMLLNSEDVFINVAGGVTINGPASDLAVVTAIASSFRDKVVSSDTLVLGEVGLSGEVRNIPQLDLRLSEASMLGLKKCVLPSKKRGKHIKTDLELVEVSSVSEALQAVL